MGYEEQVEDAESKDHEAKDLDKRVYSRDTSRMILRNLMKNGIRDEAGSLPGKTILFARNHRHAMHLAEVFTELYPMYGGGFCRVIDGYDSRAEQLIEDFKDPASAPRIAISDLQWTCSTPASTCPRSSTWSSPSRSDPM